MKQGYSEDRGVGLIGLPVTVTLRRCTVQAVQALQLKNTFGVWCLFLMTHCTAVVLCFHIFILISLLYVFFCLVTYFIWVSDLFPWQALARGTGPQQRLLQCRHVLLRLQDHQVTFPETQRRILWYRNDRKLHFKSLKSVWSGFLSRWGCKQNSAQQVVQYLTAPLAPEYVGWPCRQSGRPIHRGQGLGLPTWLSFF